MDPKLLKSIVTDLLSVITSEYKAPEQKELAIDTLVQAVAPKYAATMQAVKKNHAQYGDDLCWMDNKEIWAAAELPIPERFVGDKQAMLKNCERFVQTVCIEGGPWKTYAELEADLKKAREFKEYVHQHLDEKKVPRDPFVERDGFDSCRIGRRFEWLFAKFEYLEEIAKQLKCFSCNVKWTWANHDEHCDMAHRETWHHEWVPPRVFELTDKAVQLMNLRTDLKEETKRWRAQAANPEAATPVSREMLLLGCASTVEKHISEQKRRTDAEGNSRKRQLDR